MNNHKVFISSLLASLLLPAIALAQPGTLTQPISAVIAGVLATALSIVWTVAIAFVIIMFTIAGFKFLTAQGDPSRVADARNAVIWGLVGTTVIVLAWSAIAVVRIQLGV